MKVINLTVAVLFVALSATGSLAKTIQELAHYKGADYEQMLLEGAKKEGKVVWYTSLGGKSYKTIKAKFAEKYPDVKIEVYRAGSKDLAAKILGEAKATGLFEETSVSETLAWLRTVMAGQDTITEDQFDAAIAQRSHESPTGTAG